MDVYLAYHVVAHGGTNYHTDYNLVGVYANLESAKKACQDLAYRVNWILEWDEEKHGITQPKEHYGYTINKVSVINLMQETQS